MYVLWVCSLSQWSRLWCHVWNQNLTRILFSKTIKNSLTCTATDFYKCHCGLVVLCIARPQDLSSPTMYGVQFRSHAFFFTYDFYTRKFVIYDTSYLKMIIIFLAAHCAPSILSPFGCSILLLFSKMAPTKFTGKPCILTLKAVFSFQFNRCCSQSIPTYGYGRLEVCRIAL